MIDQMLIFSLGSFSVGRVILTASSERCVAMNTGFSVSKFYSNSVSQFSQSYAYEFREAGLRKQRNQGSNSLSLLGNVIHIFLLLSVVLENHERLRFLVIVMVIYEALVFNNFIDVSLADVYLIRNS